MHICYIHGFLSGPNAVKSTILKNYIKEHHPTLNFIAPDFPDTPKEAYLSLINFFDGLQKKDPDIALVGSSMGGFFATFLSGKYGFKAVLVNPCVHPQDYFKDLIGEHVNEVTGTKFILRPEMIETLQLLDKNLKFNPQNLKVFLQEGDEVLDYKKAQNFYAQSAVTILQGGCHAFSDFETILPEVISFLTSPN